MLLKGTDILFIAVCLIPDALGESCPDLHDAFRPEDTFDPLKILNDVLKHWDAKYEAAFPKTIKKQSIFDLRKVRNDLIHEPETFTDDKTIRSIVRMQQIFADLGAKESKAKLDELLAMYRKMARMSGSSGKYCRNCGVSLDKHADKRCPNLLEYHSEVDRLRKYCEKCGKECEPSEVVQVYTRRCGDKNCS